MYNVIKVTGYRFGHTMHASILGTPISQ